MQDFALLRNFALPLKTQKGFVNLSIPRLSLLPAGTFGILDGVSHKLAYLGERGRIGSSHNTTTINKIKVALKCEALTPKDLVVISCGIATHRTEHRRDGKGNLKGSRLRTASSARVANAL